MTHPTWDRVRCSHCSGHGMRSAYGHDGDFLGPDECSRCDGDGYVWRSPNGRLAKWPGGPFVGRLGNRAVAA